MKPSIPLPTPRKGRVRRLAGLVSPGLAWGLEAAHAQAYGARIDAMEDPLPMSSLKTLAPPSHEPAPTLAGWGSALARRRP